jgi:hypothetical protein
MKGPPRLISLTIFLLSCVISAAIGEVVVRRFGFYGNSNFEVHNTMLVNDPLLNWRHKPNSAFYENDVHYKFNEHGFRDFNYSYPKPAQTYRIFLASDSVGFGTNVQMKDSYPKILEQKLNGLSLPFRVEVINYSMPGLSFRQKFHLVELYALSYAPDLIVIDYVMNDIEFESHKNPNIDDAPSCSIALIRIQIPCALESLLKKSAFFVFVKEGVENLMHKFSWEDKNRYYDLVESDYYQSLYSRSEKRAYLNEVFKEIGNFQARHGIPIIMPIFPLIYKFETYKWTDLNELVISLCQQNSILPISLLREFRNFPYNEMRVQRGDFTHPSVKGNDVAAETITKLLFEKSLPRTSQSNFVYTN